MTTTQEVIEKLKNNSTYNIIIKDLINENEKMRNEQIKLYNEYRGQTPIKSKTVVDPYRKANNKIDSDYRASIIDGIVSYIWSIPIAYKLDYTYYKEKYKDEEKAKQVYKFCDNILQTFVRRNNMHSLDQKTGKFMSVCRFGSRLLYIDKNGDERIMHVNPWETIFIYDGSLDEPTYGIRYYTVVQIDGSKKKQRIKAELYDSQKFYTLLEDDGGNFDLIDEQYHLFDGVPLIQFKNPNLLCDFEKVANSIDAYDKIVSVATDEIENFRNSYIVIKGAKVKQDDVDKWKDSGFILVPEGGDVSYLTREINDEFFKDTKKALKEIVFHSARAIDFSDEKFMLAGESGESRKWKLLNFEARAGEKQTEFIDGLNHQFKVLCSAWNKKTYDIPWEIIEYQFTRNIPRELQYEAQATQLLKGLVSDKTRLSLLSFVPDVEEELEQIKEEQKDTIDLNQINIDEE